MSLLDYTNYYRGSKDVGPMSYQDYNPSYLQPITNPVIQNTPNTMAGITTNQNLFSPYTSDVISSTTGKFTPYLGAAGVGLQIAGGISDYLAQKQAAANMAKLNEEMEGKNARYEDLYRNDLLNNIDMKNLYQRGMMNRLPGYNRLLQNKASANKISTTNAIEDLNRRGLNNSGLVGLLQQISQDKVNEQSMNQMANLGSQYQGASGLSGFAGNNTAMNNRYNLLANEYNNLGNYGSTFGGIGNYINELNNKEINKEINKQLQDKWIEAYSKALAKEQASKVPGV